MKKIFLACAFFLFSSSAFAGYVPLSVSQSYVADLLVGSEKDVLLSTINFGVMDSEFPEGVALERYAFYCYGPKFVKDIYAKSSDGRVFDLRRTVDYEFASREQFVFEANDYVLLPEVDNYLSFYVDVLDFGEPGVVTCNFGDVNSDIFRNMSTGKKIDRSSPFAFPSDSTLDASEPIALWWNVATSDETVRLEVVDQFDEFQYSQAVLPGEEGVKMAEFEVRNNSLQDAVLTDLVYVCGGSGRPIELFSLYSNGRNLVLSLSGNSSEGMDEYYDETDTVHFRPADLKVPAGGSLDLEILASFRFAEVDDVVDYCSLKALGADFGGSTYMKPLEVKGMEDVTSYDYQVYDSFFSSVLDFEDVSHGLDYSNAIDYLARNEVISGYGDGLFRPNNFVSRAELTKILLLGSGQEEVSGGNCFPDLEKGAWYHPYVCTAKEAVDFVQGYPDGLFRPNDFVNRAEALKMVLLSHGIEVSGAASLNWYDSYVEKAEELGLLFSPAALDDLGEPVTRAEIAQMVYLLHMNQNLWDLNDVYEVGDSGLQWPVSKMWFPIEDVLPSNVYVGVYGVGGFFVDEPNLFFSVTDMGVTDETDVGEAFKSTLFYDPEDFSDEELFAAREVIGDFEVLTESAGDSSAYFFLYTNDLGQKSMIYAYASRFPEQYGDFLREMIEKL